MIKKAIITHAIKNLHSDRSRKVQHYNKCLWTCKVLVVQPLEVHDHGLWNITVFIRDLDHVTTQAWHRLKDKDQDTVQVPLTPRYNRKIS